MSSISSHQKPHTHDEWSSYWAGNRVSACMQSTDGNYNQVIGQHWLAHFSALPDNSRVLDLATGNGAVLHFAISTAQSQNKLFQLFGVDLASINPWPHIDPMIATHTGPSFLPNVSIERLPFANQMFDSVVSQYGAEYADPQATITEAVRVLRPIGTLSWICHSDNSIVFKNSCQEIEDARYMLEEVAVIDHLRNIINLQTQHDQFIQNSHQQTLHTPERQQLQTALQACFVRLKQSTQHTEILDIALQNIAYIYQHREAHSPALVIEKIEEIRTELIFFMQRLQALIDSALTADKLQFYKNYLQQLGMADIQSQPILKPDGNIVGIQLLARKPNKLRG